MVNIWHIYCGRYIQDNKYKILSESTWFCRRCDKKHLVCFCVRSSNSCSLTQHEGKVSQGTVATLFRWAGKHLNNCIANLFRTLYTKLYQNRRGFVEDMTKTFWCFFGLQCILVSFQRDCRNDGQIAVFGETFQQRLSNAKLFLVSFLSFRCICYAYLLCRGYMGNKIISKIISAFVDVRLK